MALDSVLDIEKPTIETVGSLIKQGIPVLMYSGDQDFGIVIPWTGTCSLVRKQVEQLGLHTTVSYRVWFKGQQLRLLVNSGNGVVKVLAWCSTRKRQPVVCRYLFIQMVDLYSTARVQIPRYTRGW